MAGLRKYRKGETKAAAKAFFLQFPNATIRDAKRRLDGVSERTIAQARSELVEQGLMAPGRNRDSVKPAREPIPAPDIRPSEEPDEAPEGGNRLLDDDEFVKVAKGDLDLDDLDDLDDEETRKRLLREVKKLAFGADTHPDTKLSATQVWLKLKDMAKAKDLGPGRPLTRAVALQRLTSLHAATLDVSLVIEAALGAFGPKPLVNALYALLGIKEPTDEGQTSAEPAEAERGLSGAPEAPGSDADLPAPEGPAGPL